MNEAKIVNKDWYRLPGMSSLIHDTNSGLGLLGYQNRKFKEFVDQKVKEIKMDTTIADLAFLKHTQELFEKYTARIEEALDAYYNKIKYL